MNFTCREHGSCGLCPQCCVKDPGPVLPRGLAGGRPQGRDRNSSLRAVVAHLAGEGEESGNQMLLMKSAQRRNKSNLDFQHENYWEWQFANMNEAPANENVFKKQCLRKKRITWINSERWAESLLGFDILGVAYQTCHRFQPFTVNKT